MSPLSGPTFYLGTHHPAWLARTDVPLFVSHRRLKDRKGLPVARGRWALDSGGFSELSLFGTWRTEPQAYVDAVRRYVAEIGGLDFAAIQDWMVEPNIRALTGLSVEEHQQRTVASYGTLLALAPEIPWLPVLQGWSVYEYTRCLRMYQAAGFDLTRAARVGVGSVCRRQGTFKAMLIFEELADEGLGGRMHGFGLKLGSLDRCWRHLASLDSLAWSFGARRRRREQQLWGGSGALELPNDLAYALDWGAEVSDRIVSLAARENPSARVA